MSDSHEPNGYDQDAKLIFATLETLQARVGRIEYGIVGILIAVCVNLIMKVV